MLVSQGVRQRMRFVQRCFEIHLTMSTTEDGANQTDPKDIIDPRGRNDLPPKVSRPANEAELKGEGAEPVCAF